MQVFNLDLSAKRVIPLLYAKQRDVGAKIQVKITDNKVKYAVPEDATWSIWYSGASGEGNYDKIDGRDAVEVDVDTGTATVELIYQMLDNPGPGEMCLVMNGANGTQLGLWNIPYFVEAIPGADSKAALQYYQGLFDAQAKAEAAAGRAEAALQEINLDQGRIEAQVLAAGGSAETAAAAAGRSEAAAEEAKAAAKEAANKKPQDVIVTASFDTVVSDSISRGTAGVSAYDVATAIYKGATVTLIDDDDRVYKYDGYRLGPNYNHAFFKAQEVDANGITTYMVNFDNERQASRTKYTTAYGAGSAVLHTPQTLTKEQKAWARENIGALPYYRTTREELVIAHEDVNADYIFGLYDALMAEYPGRVQKNEVHNDDGTFTNYEYVISTGEYSADGSYVKIYGNDPYAKKQKFLVLSGIHGNERNTVYSTYRFIRDVLNGHNVPNAFSEGVIISVMPIGTPSAFNAFLRQNDNAVDINRNFDSEWASGTGVDDNGNRLTHGSAAASEKETQAIAKWLNANSDAELYIDFHNSGALNEKVLILGLPDDSISGTARKIALRGVDHIIPFWRDVIGYPDKVEANGATDDGTGREVKERDTIYSYSATAVLGGASFVYAQNVVGIPSFILEAAVYYGNHTDWIADKTVDSPEAVAMGAEALGNILIEFYNNEVTNMADIDSKLETIMERVNSGFRTESGVLVIDEDIDNGTSIMSIKVPCTSGAKMLLLQAGDDTYAEIVASTGVYWTIGCFGNCVTKVGGYDNRGYLARMMPYPNDSTKWYAGDAGTTFDNTDGFSFNCVAMKAGRYNWTAYYWNE